MLCGSLTGLKSFTILAFTIFGQRAGSAAIRTLLKCFTILTSTILALTILTSCGFLGENVTYSTGAAVTTHSNPGVKRPSPNPANAGGAGDSRRGEAGEVHDSPPTVSIDGPTGESDSRKYPVDQFRVPEKYVEATVLRVVDGDTIVVKFAHGREENVRFIGIDTPEKPGSLRPAECFGTESTEFMKSLLPEGSKVLLTGGAETYDIFERLLAYVYGSNGLFLNMLMAREGFADTLSIPPNTEYREVFKIAVALARKEGLGIWGACGGADTPLAEFSADGGGVGQAQ